MAHANVAPALLDDLGEWIRDLPPEKLGDWQTTATASRNGRETG